jgi:hypothetical protein
MGLCSFCCRSDHGQQLTYLKALIARAAKRIDERLRLPADIDESLLRAVLCGLALLSRQAFV